MARKSKKRVRLHIGGGKVELPGDGWVLIDRKVGKEAYPLDYADESVDEIYASHVLEHFPHGQVQDVLVDWVRVLKPGGRLRVAVPDWDKVIEAPDPIPYMFGGQTDEDDYHKTAFSRQGLGYLLQRSGLVGVDNWTAIPGVEDCARLPVSLNMHGRKPIASLYDSRWKRDLVAVASTGRLGFTDHYEAVAGVVANCGIRLEIAQGAFWGQALQRVMERSIDAGYEFLLTLDYDTLFKPSDLVHLIALLEQHELDAIAPLQAKRGGSATPLLYRGEGISADQFAQEVATVDTAHFGFTLIRAEAVKRIPKPWFEAIPDEHGGFSESRTDSDVNFWRKFTAAGGRLAVAPQVQVGHIEMVVSWLSPDLRQVYQPIEDYRRRGKPKGAR